jgi:adenine-specific DNA-methyltransferase
MKTEYTCENCLKDFSTKAKYDIHKKRIRPCKPSKAIQAIKESLPPVPVVKDSSGSFRENSLLMNKKIGREIRKKEGIYFTPLKARQLLFEQLKTLGCKATKILEPSFGSGEFLEDVLQEFPGAALQGVEKNKELFESVLKKKLPIQISNEDFLTYTNTQKFDLILGNPPYFLIKEVNENCMIGRPNIYVAFLYKCLEEHLEEGGYLAFVLPTSLFNCSYYEPMRKYMYNKCAIHFLAKLDVDYYQTQQDTMLIILQKKKDPTHRFFFEKNGCVFLSPFAKELRQLVESASTLAELGFRVKTGEVVWNQEKEKLGANDGTLLIYNTNIVNRELVLDNIKEKDKGQYIKGFKKAPIRQQAILVNRGYGNVYKFNFIEVKNREFYAENHVNMILSKQKEDERHFPRILQSFKDPRTEQFLSWFTGNGALSATELEKILPIFPS